MAQPSRLQAKSRWRGVVGRDSDTPAVLGRKPHARRSAGRELDARSTFRARFGTCRLDGRKLDTTVHSKDSRARFGHCWDSRATFGHSKAPERPNVARKPQICPDAARRCAACPDVARQRQEARQCERGRAPETARSPSAPYPVKPGADTRLTNLLSTAQFFGYITARDAPGARRQLLGRARCHHAPTGSAATRPHIDDPVCVGNHI